MEPIKATYKAEMKRDWFVEMLNMLADCNPNRDIQVEGTGLVLSNVDGVVTHYFSGTITGALKVAPLQVWLDDLNAHMDDVKEQN